jgi:hypothetical protein
MIAVGGRKDRPFIQMCPDLEQANLVVRRMKAEGFKNITIDGKPIQEKSARPKRT